MNTTTTKNQAAAARAVAMKQLLSENEERFTELHRAERQARGLTPDPINIRIPHDKLDEAITKAEERLAKLKARKEGRG